ncbi:PREDICTED: glucose transporter type 1-like, partial [Nicrophorus vespilloides]|uniref:Glucose transporter type 1-like n=1 Tax=Nicrophorus vespilloides TaxID=110193 RepID=A0ABM1NIA1_NICVS
VFYYSTSLFTSSGLTDESAKFATIGIGAIMVGMTLVSIPLMDRTGRRTLHLYGLGGMFIFSIFITISFLIKEMIDWMSYLSVVSTLSFVVFFAVGPGSIPWMITAELFSQGPRPAAMSIAVLVNWLANFLVGIGFPSMKVSSITFHFCARKSRLRVRAFPICILYLFSLLPKMEQLANFGIGEPTETA